MVPTALLTRWSQPMSYRVPVSALVLSLTILLATGCASNPPRPKLYPNKHLDSVGAAQAEQDIDACMAKARENNVAENRNGEVGKKAAKGATLGAITAGAWGLIRGDAGERALAGAAAGAAGGAASGAFDSMEQSPIFRNFVQKCLSDKGYSVIGWQ